MLVRVMWGPREESAQEVTDRLLAALRALAAVDGDLLGRWVWPQENDQGGVDLHPLDDPEFALSVIRASEAKPPQTGYSARGWNGRRGAGEVSFKVTAGSRSKVTMNLAYLEFAPQTREEAEHWADIAEPALWALVSAWQPDHGSVWTKAVVDAQQPAVRDPFAGYVTYLCAGRLADDLAGGTRTSDGGVVFTASSLEDIVVGPIDTAASPATVTLNQTPDSAFQGAPLVVSPTADAGPVVAAQPALSLSTTAVFAVDAGTLHAGASGTVAGSNLADVAVTPDGSVLYAAAGSQTSAAGFATAARGLAFSTDSKELVVIVDGADGPALKVVDDPTEACGLLC
ncbi:extensin [Kutzneria sp. 744]|nr:extensin [Kutzneria sp. 744]